MSAQTADHADSPARPRAFESVVYGGLTVFVLDGLAAVTNSGFRGVSPVRVFQYVASGLLGPASFEGGWATFMLGVFVHFLVAFSAAAVYYLLSLKLPFLIGRAVWCGPVYGVAVYFFMSRVVVPLSSARQLPFSPAQLIIHIFCVGLPVALLARRAARAQQSREI